MALSFDGPIEGARAGVESAIDAVLAVPTQGTIDYDSLRLASQIGHDIHGGPELPDVSDTEANNPVLPSIEDVYNQEDARLNYAVQTAEPSLADFDWPEFPALPETPDLSWLSWFKWVALAGIFLYLLGPVLGTAENLTED